MYNTLSGTFINYHVACLYCNHIGCLLLHISLSILHFSYYYFLYKKFHVSYSLHMLHLQSFMFHVLNGIKKFSFFVHFIFHIHASYITSSITCILDAYCYVFHFSFAYLMYKFHVSYSCHMMHVQCTMFHVLSVPKTYYLPHFMLLLLLPTQCQQFNV